MRLPDLMGQTLPEVMRWGRDLVGQLNREFSRLESTNLRRAALFQQRAVAAGVAAAGTTQAGATAIVRDLTEVTTCTAGANDALVLPSGGAGMMLTVVNTTADTGQLFPADGETIDGGAADAPITLPAGKTAVLTCYVDKAWRSLIGA